ncbi:MAG: hypothetical protein V3R99_02255 [Thermoguttaceae bacterium]
MTVAFGIWTLLIGGVALPGIDSPGAPAWQPTQSLTSPGLGYSPGLSQPSTRFGGRSSAGLQPRIPYAPTDPNAGQAVYPMGSPTSQLNPSAGGFNNPLLDYPSLWRTPTTPPGGPRRNALPPIRPFGSSTLGNPLTVQDFRGYSPYSRQPTAGFRRPAAVIGGGGYGTSIKKPYSDYRRGGSGISPYMNLFRNDTDFGRVDNYSTLVRPRVEQINASRQAAGQIRGLQNSSRIQGSTIQRIGTQTGTVPRTTGQFFNNTQQFFPRGGR